MAIITISDFCALFTEPSMTTIALYDIDAGVTVWQGDANLNTLDAKYKERTVESIDAPNKYGVITINI